MLKLLAFSIVISTLWILVGVAFAQPIESIQDEYGSHFGGYVSRINTNAKILRIRTDFVNIKFFNPKDRLDFWNETYPNKKCQALVEARTNDYLLLRIPKYDDCLRTVHFTTGSYLHFESSDLAETIKVVLKLNEILQKKRLAMQAKKDRLFKDMSAHVEKMEAVNKRFEILKQKLELEWQKELAAIEEDKAKSFTEYKSAEARLNEIDTKLESYRLEDHNLKIDRWSLDPGLYIKK